MWNKVWISGAEIAVRPVCLCSAMVWRKSKRSLCQQVESNIEILATNLHISFQDSRFEVIGFYSATAYLRNVLVFIPCVSGSLDFVGSPVFIAFW